MVLGSPSRLFAACRAVGLAEAGPFAVGQIITLAIHTVSNSINAPADDLTIDLVPTTIERLHTAFAINLSH